MAYPQTNYQLANQVRFFAKQISALTSPEEEQSDTLHTQLEDIIERLNWAYEQARRLKDF